MDSKVQNPNQMDSVCFLGWCCCILPLLPLLLPPFLLLLVLMALLLVLSVVLLLALPKRSRGERDPRRKQGTFARPVSVLCGLNPSLLRSTATSPVSVWLSPFAFASSVGAILPLPLLFEFKSLSRERASVATARIAHRDFVVSGQVGHRDHDSATPNARQPL